MHIHILFDNNCIITLVFVVAAETAMPGVFN